ncbi:MAG: hypothetical protein V7761_04220 [Amylibacter sp.]
MTDLCIIGDYLSIFTGDLLRYIVGAGGVYLLINIGLAIRLQSRKYATQYHP